MSKNYPNHLIKKIVEDQTGFEYSLLRVDSKGKKDPATGKTMKRKMKLCHKPCGHCYEVNIYEFIEGQRRCGKCKGKILNKHFAIGLE
jgi:hypothetical protein